MAKIAILIYAIGIIMTFIILVMQYNELLTNIENGEHDPMLDSIRESIERGGYVLHTVVTMAIYMFESIIWPVSIAYGLYAVKKSIK